MEGETVLEDSIVIAVCLSVCFVCVSVGEYKESQEWFMTRDVQDVRVVSVGGVGLVSGRVGS